MNLAAILPRFAQIAFLQAPGARSLRRCAGVLREQQRPLPRHVILALENAPLQLRVLRGCVWITRDGCPEDVVIGAGEVFDQRPGARVLVQALEASQVVIAAAPAATQNA